MSYLMLAAAVAIQVLATSFISARYIRFQSRAERRQGVAWTLLKYGVFFAFIVLVIPLCMLYPLWVGAELDVLSDSPNARLCLLVVGAFGLVVSISYGWVRGRRPVVAKQRNQGEA